MAERWARNTTSLGMQYAGLGTFVGLQSLVFQPILHVAAAHSDHDLIPSAAIITAVVFTGLTVVVFSTRTDFSFLRGAIRLGFVAVLGLVVAFSCLGLPLGVWYSWLAIVVAAGWTLYDTSRVMTCYRQDQHVAAALALFASLAFLFVHVLRLLMRQRN